MTAIRSARTTLLATALAAMTATGALAGDPAGKYCGELQSSGLMSEVETSFAFNAGSGTVTGYYVFAEQGRPVEGMLAEAGDDGDRNDLTRLFIWRDKYGYGKLAVTFTPDFSEFSGQWSAGSPDGAPWNGRRCGLVTS